MISAQLLDHVSLAAFADVVARCDVPAPPETDRRPPADLEVDELVLVYEATFQARREPTWRGYLASLEAALGIDVPPMSTHRSGSTMPSPRAVVQTARFPRAIVVLDAGAA